jgi:hypothetical protein
LKSKEEIPVVHKINLSLLASEALLSIVEEYYTTGVMKSETVVIDKYELANMFDHIAAKDVLESMREYGTETNMAGLVGAIREIVNEIKEIKDDEVVEMDFTHILEAL